MNETKAEARKIVKERKKQYRTVGCYDSFYSWNGEEFKTKKELLVAVIETLTKENQ